MSEDKSKQRPFQQGHWLGHDANHRKIGPQRGATPRERSREETLAAWVGEERATEVIADLRPTTPSIAELVDEQLLAYRGQAITILDKLRQNWTAIVGHDCAQQSYPSHLEEHGTLVIEVNNSSWIYVIGCEKKDEILASVKQFLANDTVSALRIVQRGRFHR